MVRTYIFTIPTWVFADLNAKKPIEVSYLDHKIKVQFPFRVGRGWTHPAPSIENVMIRNMPNNQYMYVTSDPGTFIVPSLDAQTGKILEMLAISKEDEKSIASLPYVLANCFRLDIPVIDRQRYGHVDNVVQIFFEDLLDEILIRTEQYWLHTHLDSKFRYYQGDTDRQGKQQGLFTTSSILPVFDFYSLFVLDVAMWGEIQAELSKADGPLRPFKRRFKVQYLRAVDHFFQKRLDSALLDLSFAIDSSILLLYKARSYKESGQISSKRFPGLKNQIDYNVDKTLKDFDFFGNTSFFESESFRDSLKLLQSLRNDLAHGNYSSRYLKYKFALLDAREEHSSVPSKDSEELIGLFTHMYAFLKATDSEVLNFV